MEQPPPQGCVGVCASLSQHQGAIFESQGEGRAARKTGHHAGQERWKVHTKGWTGEGAKMLKYKEGQKSGSVLGTHTAGTHHNSTAGFEAGLHIAV